MRPLLSLSASLLISACPAWAGETKVIKKGALIPMTITVPLTVTDPLTVIAPRTRTIEDPLVARPKKAAAEVETACGGSPPWSQCDEAKAILQEALAFSKKTQDCPGGCPALEALVFEGHMLMDRYLKLKHPEHKILSLYMLVSDGSDRLAAIRPPDPIKLAAAGVEAFCATAPAKCGDLRKLLADVTDLTKRKVECAAAPCALAELDRLNTIADEAPQRLRQIDSALDRRLSDLFGLVYRKHPELEVACDRAFKAELSSLGRGVTLVEQKTGKLEVRQEAGAKPQEIIAGLTPLATEGQSTLELFQGISLMIDRAGQPNDKRILALRDQANGVAVRLGNLRDRLIALQQFAQQPSSPRLDLGKLLKGPADAADGKHWQRQVKSFGLKTLVPALFLGGAAAVADMPVSGGHAGAVGPAVARASYVLSKPKRTLLDAPRVPPPATVSPISALDKSLSLQEALFTKVVGDPVARAKLVHRQTGPTCAVVSQQQILQAYGVIKPGNPRKEETRLRDLAASKGYYDNGTPSKFEGNILLDHGMIISKHANASDAQLDRAVGTGKILLVTVDAGVLWGKSMYIGGNHAIVVTGARVGRLDGKVTGYYINDSGAAANSMRAGRYLPAAAFLKAFHAGSREIIEVQ